ncbi:four helix bundle protein [Belliella sp. R4-6]|uniref:Four helix bundle protein n=2 Tax=Belliella TaxID=232244 RepID=A0ABS9UP90_9BACT|nr:MULTISPECIES: four helix bundle protein [Belliella]MCH7398214.1 four helix bundle protein [Belliella calami]MCH7413550.1 four helix bundle protein [Belliella alkalica]
MAKVSAFEDLEIWKEAVRIAVEIYRLADLSPLRNDYKSRDQIIGAAISISNNIAEGFEYNNNKVFVKYLHYAKGSAGEVRSQLAILVAAGRVNNQDYEKLKMDLFTLSSKIKSFINYLNTYNQKNNK